jgi:hypothetical protein
VTCSGAEVDLRVGGRYRIDNALPDGKTLSIEGEFQIVEGIVRPKGVEAERGPQRVSWSAAPLDATWPAVPGSEIVESG